MKYSKDLGDALARLVFPAEFIAIDTNGKQIGKMIVHHEAGTVKIKVKRTCVLDHVMVRSIANKKMFMLLNVGSRGVNDINITTTLLEMNYTLNCRMEDWGF
jgi:hypothetical protein